MGLSRKRRRELRRLRADAQDLLDQQKDVLGHAGNVLGVAGKQAKALSDEYVAPRVEQAVDTVRPYVKAGVASGRRAADKVRIATAPWVANTLARTIKALDEIESHEAAQQVQRFGERAGYLKPEKKAGKIFGRIALVAGIGAAVAVGWGLWQAFRTDDELWVEPEA